LGRFQKLYVKLGGNTEEICKVLKQERPDEIIRPFLFKYIS